MNIAGNVALLDTSLDDPVPAIMTYHKVRVVTWGRDDGVGANIQSYADESDWEDRGWNGPRSNITLSVQGPDAGPPVTGSDTLEAWYAGRLIATVAAWADCTVVA